MKACMVSYGMMGKWHSPALRDGGVELYTLVGHRPEAAAAFAEAHGYRCWTLSLNEALADPVVNAVILAIPSEGAWFKKAPFPGSTRKSIEL